MKFSNVFTTVLPLLSVTLLGAFAPFAVASPTASKDVFVPPVTSPVEGAVWKSGETQLVTWDTSNAPVNITNSIGFILLRSNGIVTPVVLADNFPILRGQVEVTVPLVLTRDDFSIVLFGDSGNFSPNFTIEGLTI
ncbi:hypothetical protein C8Q75DRAFT_779809 [Abortiporus biennis]|nr:hypothetical protein C8Q75DRAFT_779809 [Abortiporus biennis]